MNLPIPSTFQTRVVAGLTVSLLVSCNWLINNILNDYYYYYFDLNYSHCKLSLWILMEIILQYTKTRGYLWRGRVGSRVCPVFNAIHFLALESERGNCHYFFDRSKNILPHCSRFCFEPATPRNLVRSPSGLSFSWRLLVSMRGDNKPHALAS